MKLEVYRLTKVVQGKGDRPVEEQVVEVIRDLIEPESWKSEEKVYVRSIPGAIIIRHRAAVHKEIVKLLIKLGLYNPWTYPPHWHPATPPPFTIWAG